MADAATVAYEHIPLLPFHQNPDFVPEGNVSL